MEKRTEDVILGPDPHSGIGKLRDIRNKWLAELEVRQKGERLFELEMCLKALDRFCIVKNHPIVDMENVFERDFKAETLLLRDLMYRVITLVKGLLPEEKSSVFSFKSYVERRIANDRTRMDLLERDSRQANPEESLYVLESAMTSMREIASHLALNKKITYSLFQHLGFLISREIAMNLFFNPFHLGEFSPNHDRIRNAAILKIVKEKVPNPIRKDVSIVFLICFRLLHYLQYVKDEVDDRSVLLQNLPFFVLVRSEILILSDYLEHSLPGIIKSKKLGSDEELFIEALESITFQMDMETKKVFDLEILDAANEKDLNKLRTGMARSKGVLVEILRQVVVQSARILDQSVEGRHIFRDYISRTELSLKLRKDLWIFRKVVDNFDRTITQSGPKKEFKPILEAFKSLRNYIYYFQNVSFQMVRFTDREAFEDFFHTIDTFVAKDVSEPEKLDALRRQTHVFTIYLDTTLGNISQRNELRDKPFGASEGEQILEQFLK